MCEQKNQWRENDFLNFLFRHHFQILLQKTEKSIATNVLFLLHFRLKKLIPTQITDLKN